MTTSNQKTQSIRWGVIGPGHAGSRFAQGLEAVEAASLHAVWGRTPNAPALSPCASLSLNQKTRSASSSAGLDAIHVATHPDSRTALGVRFPGE